MLARLSVAAAALTITAAAHAEPITVEPGLWENVITLSMGGVEMPPQTSTECITADEATQTPEQIVQEVTDGGQCTIENMNQTPGQLSFDLACTEEGTSFTGSMEMTHTATVVTMAGQMSMDVQGQAFTVDMNGVMSRTGACS